MTALLYFDDIEIGRRDVCGSVTVDGDDMLAFAQKWDPLPIHVDMVVAQRATGGLTAPGLYVLALKQRLVHAAETKAAVIASMGYDEVRFHKPARAGDRLTLTIDWTDKRLSSSHPDRGIVTHRLSLLDDSGDPVMSHFDTILVRRRSPD
ncbi:MaoC/PaaZ C-terminal domain-containing protein [Leisingera sp. ANG59]|uniref:MaoC/PaaZ C-terminal domain-containing protein n=1 Tax=Leisingera sp. ANG59 TaxID=2675221 RepID=UPI001573245F|nr:MaoC/PaaZ C-terminal domain-containing protein [Leisingera sp. ANG59]NSY39356.1 acyl dehydratase [Leisingera sp. ANG59]